MSLRKKTGNNRNDIDNLYANELEEEVDLMYIKYELTSVNASLEQQGLLNKRSTLAQGYWRDSSGSASIISNNNWISDNELKPIKQGDSITLVLSSVSTKIAFCFYDSSKNFVSVSSALNVKEFVAYAPSGVAYVGVSFGGSNITPSSVSKFDLYINNEIYEVKAALGDISVVYNDVINANSSIVFKSTGNFYGSYIANNTTGDIPSSGMIVGSNTSLNGVIGSGTSLQFTTNANILTVKNATSKNIRLIIVSYMGKDYLSTN